MMVEVDAKIFLDIWTSKEPDLQRFAALIDDCRYMVFQFESFSTQPYLPGSKPLLDLLAKGAKGTVFLPAVLTYVIV